jgi:pepF/M3 family oligoendopeptidase
MFFMDNPRAGSGDAAANAPSASAASAPPRWDMTPVFPGLDSPEFARGFDAVVRGIADLAALFDAEEIRKREGANGNGLPATAELARTYEAVTARYNAVQDAVREVVAYLNSFITTDSRNDAAQAKMSELRQHLVTLSLLGTRYVAFLGSIDVEALIATSPVAAAHAYPVRRARIAAAHQLPPGEEELAARLSPGAGTAWAKLHGDLTSQLTVPFAAEPGADPEPVPMSVIRAMATDPDRDLRRRAYEAELAGWRTVAVPLAAAMNSIKYEAGTLARRRGWESPLDAALFNNHIDRPTLDAMLGAARASFPDFRRYLRAKARVLGAERLPWYDLFAPVGDASAARAFAWPEAETFVAENFGAYSDKMRAFAERTFRERWIDAEPRPGKRDGAFCMGVRGDESRILQNYRPSFDGVSTLAHELGHAYHNTCLAGRTYLQRGTPMTLAETASIFCETIIRQAALATAAPAEQVVILEGALQGDCQVVVDITSRFLFESHVFAKRQERELSVDELCRAMTDAQKETYGDGLDENLLHPFMWAMKPHYYGASFYNFPYMFGLLFGLGLYAQYQTDPEPFRARYDDLLSSTGLDDAATLAARFGIDIRDQAFWASSLGVIRADIDRLVALLEA